MPQEAEPATPQSSDVTRRTWLAAERTWLAWWRTGIGASAVAIGVGRRRVRVAGRVGVGRDPVVTGDQVRAERQLSGA